MSGVERQVLCVIEAPFQEALPEAGGESQDEANRTEVHFEHLLRCLNRIREQLVPGELGILFFGGVFET